MEQRKKRRFGAVCAAILLVLAMFPAALLLSDAAGGEILMISGYDILPPVKEQMPFLSGNILYAPVVLFSSQDVSVTITQTGLTLANITHTLFFDTQEGRAYDQNNNTYLAQALYRNGYWFVPVQFAAERLNLHFSRHIVDPAPFIRISQKEFMLSDEVLLRTYAFRAQRVLDEYRQGETTAPTAQSSVLPQTTPPVHQTTLPATAPPVTAAPKKYRIYLLFDGISHNDLILTRLQSAGVLATFLISEADIFENPGQIRKIAAAGHSFALAAATPESAENTAAALFSLCYRPAFVVFGAESAEKQALADAGFTLWETGLTLDGGAPRQDLSVLQSYVNRRISGALVHIRPGENAETLLAGVFSLFAPELPEYCPILPIDAPVLR